MGQFCQRNNQANLDVIKVKHITFTCILNNLYDNNVERKLNEKWNIKHI